MLLFIIFLLWLGLAGWVASIAESKGRNPIEWGVLGLCLGLIALVIVACLSNEKVVAIEAPRSSPTDELLKLADLRDRGVLSADEFESMKGAAMTGQSVKLPVVAMAGLSVPEAAERWQILESTLRRWIEKAHADGPAGGIVQQDYYPDLIITRDGDDLKVAW